MSNPFDKYLKSFDAAGKPYKFYELNALDKDRVERLPFSVRVLLESAVRNCDGFLVTEDVIETILNWDKNAGKVEIPFMPARVLMQDFTGVPAVVDLAAMRDAYKALGGDPAQIKPLIPVDMVIDHSVQVDFSGTKDSLEKNEELEFSRNKERFGFLKWGSTAFDGLQIVPPGTGIVHQVNLEYLARVAFEKNSTVYPDSLVGTDSHTTMINGLGCLGWGVGGIEAESAMLGTPCSFLLPPVVGFEFTGELKDGVTATDLVLTCVDMLRKLGVVGKFVEYYGPGVKSLSLADRATIANMAPEYGATCGFFPVDTTTLDYLRLTGRTDEQLDLIDKYYKASGLMNEGGAEKSVAYTEKISLDLSSVEPCVAGPKRPQDLVTLANLKTDWMSCFKTAAGFKAFGMPADEDPCRVETLEYEGKTYDFKHGSVVIAAITSCTNTSNPSVMLGAGLVAKKAVEAGLSVAPYIKTSLAPGSGVASEYLKSSGLLPYLEQLGFDIVGFGCTTCIGNSGELKPGVGEVIRGKKMVAASVLSGNRNFEARVHPDTVSNYLMSPPLVVAFALAGNSNIDVAVEPLGHNKDGKAIYLKDIWPSSAEVNEVVAKFCLPEYFKDTYAKTFTGNPRWNALETPKESLYSWPKSTYINNPPFFKGMQRELPTRGAIKDARCLLYLGDSVTTDHISPAGRITADSPAGRWLKTEGVEQKDFNTYGSRRGNDLIMARGTFANVRLSNKIVNPNATTGPVTVFFPTGEQMAVFDAAAKYIEAGINLVILAGREYGSGSSRDWAAKGPFLQGVSAVIAESYERIHRANLVGMGIIPFTFKAGQTAGQLGLKGDEKISIHFPQDPTPGQDVTAEAVDSEGNVKKFDIVCRLDTKAEVGYYKNGGILPFVLRRLL